METILGEGMKIAARRMQGQRAGIAWNMSRSIALERDRESCWYVVCGRLRHPDRRHAASCTSRPAFGEDDARVGRRYDLPFRAVGGHAGLHGRGDPLAGRVRQGRRSKLIIADLKATRPAVCTRRPSTHNYPFCWRCDTPLIYYARAHLVHQDDRACATS